MGGGCCIVMLAMISRNRFPFMDKPLFKMNDTQFTLYKFCPIPIATGIIYGGYCGLKANNIRSNLVQKHINL